jgi:two-component system copper resistance phosphate regulon response regulator CusR
VKILVVEDEPKTAAYLHNGLAENGFVADVSVNGADGLHAALTTDYDLRESMTRLRRHR